MYDSLFQKMHLDYRGNKLSDIEKEKSVNFRCRRCKGIMENIIENKG